MEVFPLLTKIGKTQATLSAQMGVDRKQMVKLLKLVENLDQNFTMDNWTAITTHIQTMKLNKLEWKIEKKLNKSGDSKVHIDKNTEIVRATSKVLLDCEYRKQPCIVKVMETTIDKIGLFVESIINMFMSAVIRDEVNIYISTPDILAMGIVDESPIKEASPIKVKEASPSNKYILVQEKIKGKEFKKIIDGSELLRAMKTLCMGLQILQKNYSFAHRDFHSGNVMYNPEINKVYIIDFGYACFSIPKTVGSIQHVGGGFGFNQFEDEYKVHQRCLNKSHDLCVLILSLLCQIPDENERKTSIPWLYNLGADISARYKAKIAMKKPTTGWEDMDLTIRQTKTDRPFTFDKEIIHYWYLYEMFEIDIGMGPTEILEALEAPSDSELRVNQAFVYQPLKF